jgi:SAM-dependent methyltransferase
LLKGQPTLASIKSLQGHLSSCILATMPQSESIYDLNDYYDSSKAGSRLTPILDQLTEWLDAQKSRKLARDLGLKKNARILDVGAGTGNYLHAMRSCGMEVFGSTASKISQDAALERFDIALEFTESLDPFAKEAPFDLISYWHVFEHLSNDRSHIEMWSSLLSPGGWLVMEVPHIDSFGAKFCYPSWLGSDDEHHINHRSKEYISEQITNQGLEVKREIFFSMKFSYVFLWSSLLGFLFGQSRYSFDTILLTLKSPLRMLRKSPILTIHLIASVFYLAPIVIMLLALQAQMKNGEIYRIYARKPLAS